MNRKYLSPTELKNFFTSIDNMRNFLIFGLIFECGLRPSEIACDNRGGFKGLRIRDIEEVLLGNSNLIHLTRAKYHPQGRDVVLGNQLIIEELRKFISPGTDTLTYEQYEKYITTIRDEPVFLSQKRNAISVQQIQALFKKYAKKAGIQEGRQYPYMLRHTHAVAFVKNKGSVESLRKNLGHSNIRTTSIYIEMVMQDVEEDYKEMYNNIGV